MPKTRISGGVEAKNTGYPGMSSPDTLHTSKQLLHLVFGGELKNLDSVDFADLSKLDIVGIYPNYAEAHKAWKAQAQRTVDNAQVRYFIVHIHRLLEPHDDPKTG